MATLLNPIAIVEVQVLHLQRARMERQGQQMERRNHTYVRYVRGDSRLEDIFNVIRGYIPESRHSCVHSPDVRLGQAGRIIYSNSTSDLLYRTMIFSKSVVLM
jgi:hypothetical protein